MKPETAKSMILFQFEEGKILLYLEELFGRVSENQSGRSTVEKICGWILLLFVQTVQFRRMNLLIHVCYLLGFFFFFLFTFLDSCRVSVGLVSSWKFGKSKVKIIFAQPPSHVILLLPHKFNSPF